MVLVIRQNIDQQRETTTTVIVMEVVIIMAQEGKDMVLKEIIQHTFLTNNNLNSTITLV
jgi:hypothetical protein